MQSRPGKILALSAMVPAVTVLALFFPALKRTVLECWYIRQLESEDASTRHLAAERLGDIGSEGAVRALASTVAAPSANLRLRAASVLGRMGKVARAAAPALIRALRQRNDADLRREAALALGNIGMEADMRMALPALRVALDDEDETIGAHAHQAIEKITGDWD